jgi:hypothetical protein
LFIAAQASAATLTITPDQQTYQVGETIALSVFGDAEGATGGNVFGRVLFDGTLANWMSSSQVALTSFDGAVGWTQGALSGGAGFATAFNQLVSESPIWPIDTPLFASVILQAEAPGTLMLNWDAISLIFFGLTGAPGASVLVVPEPSAGLLVALGTLEMVTARARKT